MESIVNINEFVKVDADFTDYGKYGESVPSSKYEFARFQAHITKDELSIQVGYTDSNVSVNGLYNATTLEFKDGIIPLSHIIEWTNQLNREYFDFPYARDTLIATMNNFINKSLKIYAMYQEGLL